MLSEVGSFQLLGCHCCAQGHETHIDEVGAARATEVGMGEAINDVFVVVVTRTGIPSDHQLGLGTQLHHALGHRGARKGATTQRSRFISLCADEGIDILGVVVGALGT